MCLIFYTNYVCTSYFYAYQLFMRSMGGKLNFHTHNTNKCKKFVHNIVNIWHNFLFKLIDSIISKCLIKYNSYIEKTN